MFCFLPNVALEFYKQKMLVICSLIVYDVGTIKVSHQSTSNECAQKIFCGKKKGKYQYFLIKKNKQTKNNENALLKTVQIHHEMLSKDIKI